MSIRTTANGGSIGDWAADGRYWRRRMLALLQVVALGVAAFGVQAVAAPVSSAHAASPEDCKVPGPGTQRGHSGMDTDYTNRFIDPVGTHRAITLFVDFQDESGVAADRVALIDKYSAAVDWYDHSSYGRTGLDITWDTAWHRMPKDSAEYYDNPRETVAYSSETFRDFMQDAVAAADPQVNFSTYDIIYVVVPSQVHNSHFRSAAYIINDGNTGWYLHTDEGPVRHAALVAWGSDQDHRIFVHETGHLFGLPDLVDYAGEEPIAVGGWDLMGATWGAAPDHLAWHKWKQGWIDDHQVYCIDAPAQTTQTLSPLHTSWGLKMVVVRTGANEAVVVEYRAANGPIDGVPGQVPIPSCFRPGALVYKVYGDKVGGDNPIEVLDAYPDSHVAGCYPNLQDKDDATLRVVNDEVTDPHNGVRVRLVSDGAFAHTVQVTWP